MQKNILGLVTLIISTLVLRCGSSFNNITCIDVHFNPLNIIFPKHSMSTESRMWTSHPARFNTIQVNKCQTKIHHQFLGYQCRTGWSLSNRKTCVHGKRRLKIKSCYHGLLWQGSTFPVKILTLAPVSKLKNAITQHKICCGLG